MRKQARIKRKLQRIRNHRDKQTKKVKKCYSCGIEDKNKLLKCECISYHHKPLIGEDNDA